MPFPHLAFPWFHSFSMHFDFLFIAGFSFYRHFSLHSSFILIGFPHKVKMWLTAIDSFWSNYWFARFMRKKLLCIYIPFYISFFFFYIILYYEQYTQCSFISSVCKMYSYIHKEGTFRDLRNVWSIFESQECKIYEL